MQETYNRMRAQILVLDEMMLKARTPAARERLAKQRKDLKAESHSLLLTIHAEQSAARLAAEKELSAAQVLEKAAFSASMQGVVTDFLPRRVRLWLSREAQRRKSGATARKPSRFEFLAVLIGVRR